MMDMRRHGWLSSCVAVAVLVTVTFGCSKEVAKPSRARGIELYQQKEYDRALENLQPLAASDPLAAYYCGRIEDDRHRREQADEYYEMAAVKGHVDAQYRLGFDLLQQEDNDGAVWLERAANVGSRDAMTQLGMFHGSWSTTPRNYDETVKWYVRAAELGDSLAQSNLAGEYEYPEDAKRTIKPDLVKAYTWVGIVERTRYDLGSMSVMGNLKAEATPRLEKLRAKMKKKDVDAAERAIAAWIAAHPKFKE
jgi:TPR repeat protein